MTRKAFPASDLGLGGPDLGDAQNAEDPLEAASRSERRITERVQNGGFAVALSGGGHRATLAAIGALLALVDRRLNHDVLQITSVSGGSIANAHIAQRCDFDRLEPGDLDDTAADLARTVVEKGALTGWWIAAIFVGAAVVWGAVSALLILAGLGELGSVATVAAIVLGFLAGLGALLGGGHVVEWLLDHRYFRPTSTGGVKPHRRAVIRSLAGRAVDHVFGMTDLVLGQPFYVSSQQGGMACRRLGPSPDPIFKPPQFRTFDAGDWSIAKVVRASAAFPGIPPRRVAIPFDNRFPEDKVTLAFLGDGGVWNNLGTQVLREGMFLGLHGAREQGIPRPLGGAPYMPLLIVNGSAQLKPTHTVPFQVPGMAQIFAFFQTAQVLSANTVEPRVDTILRAFKRRSLRGRRPDYMDPLDIIVDLRDPTEFVRRNDFSWDEASIRLSDEAVKDWERGVVSQARFAMEFREGHPDSCHLGRMLQSEPVGSPSAPGLADGRSWDALTKSQAWKTVVELEGAGRVDAKTTLDRIEGSMARRIIARTYLNTFVASLYLAPLGEGDIDRLASLPARLDRMLPEHK